MDPNGLKAGVNLFSYVLNNPINAIDPLGMDGMYPDAEMVGFSGTLGILGGVTYGSEVVTNTESGEIPLFVNAGFEAGVTSFSGNVKAGVVWNLNKNSDYRGPFLSANIGGGPIGKFGVSAFATSDKLMSPNIIPGAYGISGSIGASLIPLTASGSSTYYRDVITIPYLGYILNPIDSIINYFDKGPSPISSLDNTGDSPCKK